MKLLTTALITLFLVLGQSALGQNKTYKFIGKVHAYGEPLKGAKVEVYKAGDLIHESFTKGSGKFEFELEAEKEYMVEISMESMRTKIIWINTKKTHDLKFKLPVFGFDVYLKREKVTPYDELSKIPVTLIKYNPKKKAFYMDKNYENTIKNMKRNIKESKLQMR